MKKLMLPLGLALVFTGVTLLAAVVKEKTPNVINDQYSFTFQFPEKPKMGTSNLQVNLLNKNKEKVKDLVILVSYDMPSMKGKHGSSGKPVPMQINKKNDYLAPLNFVMKGTWEVTLTFQKDKKNIFTGTFNVEI